MINLKGKNAIVTGGTKGIGLEIAKSLKKNGANVVVCSRNKHNFNYKNIEFYSLDISNSKDCKLFANYFIKKYKHIDILVNNAGIICDKTTMKMSQKNFNLVIKTNLVGTFNVVKSFSKYMIKMKYGSIINISSVVSKSGNIGQVNYVASKSAIEGMSKCWAKEFTMHGENIRVNTIRVGATKTDMLLSAPEKIINYFKSKTLLRRLAEPKEIANVVTFLASDSSSYITNSIIDVDGGLNL